MKKKSIQHFISYKDTHSLYGTVSKRNKHKLCNDSPDIEIIFDSFPIDQSWWMTLNLVWVWIHWVLTLNLVIDVKTQSRRTKRTAGKERWLRFLSRCRLNISASEKYERRCTTLCLVGFWHEFKCLDCLYRVIYQKCILKQICWNWREHNENKYS